MFMTVNHTRGGEKTLRLRDDGEESAHADHSLLETHLVSDVQVDRFGRFTGENH